jgi:pentatricopeptide repeat protein
MIEKAQQIFYVVPKQGFNPTVIVYNTLYGLCKVNNLKEAMNLFKQIKDSGHVPNMITYVILHITYAILMDKLCKEGTLQGANRLLHEILRNV